MNDEGGATDTFEPDHVTAVDGLTEAEAADRLAAFGPNVIAGSRRRSIPAIIAGALREPMFALLFAATALYLALGDLGEGLLLASGALVAIGLVVFQEARSEGALAALRSLAEPTARVLREGVERRLPARELVPGDLIRVSEGERLPADAVLIEGDVLRLDESTLTGESASVTREPGALADTPRAALPGGDGGSWIFAGTLVVQGHGLAQVALTGTMTALGGIGHSLSTMVEESTPLQRSTRSLVRIIGVIAITFSMGMAVVLWRVRDDWLEGLLSGLTLAIALIPEEFPMVLAVFLALGAWRLAQKKVLVRRAAAVETLGATSVLCVDKTGTLTENRMRLAGVWADGRTWRPGDGPTPVGADRLLLAAARASRIGSPDPMDRALIETAPPDSERDLEHQPARTWPIEIHRLAMVHLWRNGDRETAAAKGAAEAIFHLCRLPDDQIGALQQVLADFAAQGWRVLGVAEWRGPGPFPDAPEDAHFAFLGFVAFEDPLRTDVIAALALARQAGVTVAMITGDHPATALEIARRAGIVEGGILTGADIAAMSPEDLQVRVRTTSVFARIAPQQKLLLVEAYKANGEIVAMTGDGVNDGPALEAAHVGIAMGQRGADVAREAADLVLLDDSFRAIIDGIALGRRISANLRKALTYILAIHVPIVGAALVPLLLGWPPLLMPVHVVLLELIVDPMCSLVFEAEPSEAASMRRPPRRLSQPLFGIRQIAWAGVLGLVLSIGVVGVYGWGLGQGDEHQARGAALITMTLANLALAMATSRTAGVSVFDRRHRLFWAVAAVAVAALAAGILLPSSAALLGIAAPPVILTVIAVVTALAVGGWTGLLGDRRPSVA